MTHPDHPMSFGDHLEELRTRVLWALAIPLPVMILAYFFAQQLLTWILRPLFIVLANHGLPTQVQQLEPVELFFTQIRLAILCGVVVGAPWIIFQLWLFVRPGLYQHERRFVHLLLPGSALMTFASVALTYLLMLPFMLEVLIAIGAHMSVELPDIPLDPRVQNVLAAHQHQQLPVFHGPPASLHDGDMFFDSALGRTQIVVTQPDGSLLTLDAPRPNQGVVRQDFRLSEYVNFVLLLLLAMAIAAQLPLVVMLLGWVGLVSPAFLRAHRRHALFLTAIAAAIITPTGDPFSLMLMWIPLYALYELGLILLVLAPAGAVAQGRIFSRIWRRPSASVRRSSPLDQHSAGPGTDKAPPRSAQSPRSAQTEHTVHRAQSSTQTSPALTDADEGDE